jgi:hypothetical protein
MVGIHILVGFSEHSRIRAEFVLQFTLTRLELPLSPVLCNLQYGMALALRDLEHTLQ